MATPKLSIIVPIYNVEPYLRKCVESLLTQDLDPAEYEIILVDDGSTDGCPAICDEYAQTLHPSGGSRKGANIKVIHQPNGGLSAARNTGIMAAKGDYVCFVDSDDYWEPNVLGGLMAQVERDNLDVLRFKWQNVRIGPTNRAELYNPALTSLQSERSSTNRTYGATGNAVEGSEADSSVTDCNAVDSSEADSCNKYKVFNPNKSDPYRLEDYSSEVTIGEEFLNTRFGYACYAVQFIIRRSLLSGQYSVFSNQCSEVSGQWSALSSQSSEVSAQYSEVSTQKSAITNNKSQILFTPNLHFEDTDWTPRMLLAAQRVASTDTMVYDYLVREGSITKVGANLDKKRRNIEDSMLIVERLGGLSKQHPKCVWLRRMQSSMAAGIIHSVIAVFPAERRDYVRRLRQWHVFPLVVANQGRTYTRRARIMNISTWLYAIIAKLR